MPQREVWSLVGRIVHYCPLVLAGRFNICHLIRINGKSEDRNARVEIEDCVKRQMKFWLIVLNVTDGLATIPGPLLTAPAWARDFYTDAAGGSAGQWVSGAAGCRETGGFTSLGGGR